MQFFDSHAHLSSLEIFPNIEQVLTNAKNASVSNILNICTCGETLKKGLLIEEKYPNVKNAGATTPHDVQKEGDLYFPIFSEYAKSKKLIAVGETGLDYFYKHSDIASQKKFLVKYLHLAAENNLPVIFHCREAFSDLFSIVDQEYPKNGKAILHCFTGTILDAENVLKRGWYLSLSGIVTFKKSTELQEIAKITPLSQLLIETDSPYLAPLSHRGKQNEPSFLPETARCIATLKDIPLEELANKTYANTKKVLNLT